MLCNESMLCKSIDSFLYDGNLAFNQLMLEVKN